MARRARIAPAGLVYHVMNRTAGKFVMHRTDQDYAAFERILIEAHQREPLPIFSYCVMGNHWHFVVRPRREGQRRLTGTEIVLRPSAVGDRRGTWPEERASPRQV